MGSMGVYIGNNKDHILQQEQQYLRFKH